MGLRKQQQPGLRLEAESLLPKSVLSSNLDTKSCFPFSQPTRKKKKKKKPPSRFWDHQNIPYQIELSFLMTLASIAGGDAGQQPGKQSHVAVNVGSMASSPTLARIHELGPVWFLLGPLIPSPTHLDLTSSCCLN